MTMPLSSPSGAVSNTKSSIIAASPRAQRPGRQSLIILKLFTTQSDYMQPQPNPLAGIPNLPPEVQAEANKPIPCQAWIGSKTNLPVAAQIDTVRFEFVFNTPPKRLDLPPAYEQAWKKHQDQLARLEALKSQ